jgi:outer membrane murein-binding lipoprotein Lpp
MGLNALAADAASVHADGGEAEGKVLGGTDRTGRGERRTVVRSLVVVVVVSGLVLGACSNDPTASEEYRELEQQVSDLQAELADVTGERDQLLAADEADEARLATVTSFMELRNDVATDPSAYGTEAEVLDLLSEGAAPGAVMDDEAYGAIELREAWRRTLYGGNVDAVTTEWRSWVCNDGRMSGSLWTWEGTNFVGEPFSLVGINLNTYDDEGRQETTKVIWPYPHEHVYEEFGVGP